MFAAMSRLEIRPKKITFQVTLDDFSKVLVNVMPVKAYCINIQLDAYT